MASYRFCRSDDVPLLVEAYNACYRVHFPELPEMTVDAFKRLIRELNLWTSSCMVASVAGRAVGVMLAAKRDGIANWIHSVGVHPDHQRQGHGRHLMTSLSQKLAILGPRRMLLELPADAAVARRFVEACGYREDVRYADFTRAAGTPGEIPEIVIPTTLDELVQSDAIDLKAQRCWERTPESLLNLGERLQGLAIASGERIEAYVLFDDEAEPQQRRIMAFEAKPAEPVRAERMLTLLFDACGSATDRALYLPRIAETEIDFDRLARLGFEHSSRTLGYVSEAHPG